MSDDIRIDYEDEGRGPPEGFTGLWEYYWPNRTLKFRGHFVNGQPHGSQSCWWDDGRLAQTGVYEHGKCKGIWVEYLPEGPKFKETEYNDSGDFVIRWYDGNGSLYKTDRFATRNQRWRLPWIAFGAIGLLPICGGSYVLGYSYGYSQGQIPLLLPTIGGLCLVAGGGWIIFVGGWQFRSRSRPTFAVSLLTILIVAAVIVVPLGWINRQLSWISERREARQWLEQHQWPFGRKSWSPSDRALPWTLIALGERPLLETPMVRPLKEELDDLPKYHSHVERVVQLFPECEIDDISRRISPDRLKYWVVN